MRTLILMRHAKSDWSAPELSDHQRTLNARGRRDAPRMGQWMQQQELIPEVVLASTAVRVRETVAAILEQWSAAPPVHYSNDLYLAPPETILRCVRSDSLGAQRVLVVGHNPGLAALVESLAQSHSYAMATAAVAAFQLPIEDWQPLSAHSPVAAVTYGCP
ncbi:SixA phosphatase family protein [Candidatus Laterigemmans baculatus]|uniref:SixA phosphatase family protein n=1 Tax=Candidatus Laterigemmans baculatus TaxID=2770505 RepID=UPI0013DCFE21|nr:histidine phosphatase family protein [Candidatus Laterigemmans baculatus]